MLDRWATLKDLSLVYHTGINLEPRQVLGMVERKLRHTIVPKLPVDCDAWYQGQIPQQIQSDPTAVERNVDVLQASLSDHHRTTYQQRVSELEDGTLSMLGQSFEIGELASFDWDYDTIASFPPLWRLHLYALEPVNWLVCGYDGEKRPDEMVDIIRQLLRSWDDNVAIGGAQYLRREWTPHAVSLRVLRLCRLYAWLQDSEPAFAARVQRLAFKNACFLANHVEYDVGGNHLIENGAALLMAGSLFGEHGHGWRERGISILEKYTEVRSTPGSIVVIVRDQRCDSARTEPIYEKHTSTYPIRSVSTQHMELTDTVSLSWPDERVIYLTLDLECDYGTALSANTYEAARKTDQLVDLLERYSAPLTCFVQTEVLEEAPIATQTLAEADVPVSFHAHSHTHPPRAEADVEYEVRESVARVQSEFETQHIGYRFPDGDAYPTDYDILGRHDVQFSSTLFPSWRPGRFNNARRDRKPFCHRDSGVVELPFTVHSDLIRIPVSISYLKFLGRGYDWLVKQDPPSIIIFDMHMHDLVLPDTFSELPRRYKLVYGRHKHDGFTMLDRLLDSLQTKGYQFGELTRLYERVTEVYDE